MCFIQLEKMKKMILQDDMKIRLSSLAKEPQYVYENPHPSPHCYELVDGDDDKPEPRPQHVTKDLSIKFSIEGSMTPAEQIATAKFVSKEETDTGIGIVIDDEIKTAKFRIKHQLHRLDDLVDLREWDIKHWHENNHTRKYKKRK